MITEVYVESGVTNVGNYAFFGYNLEKLYLSESVTAISDYAFFGCSKNIVLISSQRLMDQLTDIYKCGYLLNNTESLRVPASISVTNYIKNNYIQERVSQFGEEYVSYSKHKHSWCFVDSISEQVGNVTQYTDLYGCTKCGEVKTLAVDHEHIFDEGWEKEPTCLDAGVYVIACRACGLIMNSIDSPALGHDETHHEAKEPTDTEVGWHEYITCSRCDYTTYEEIPSLGDEILLGDVDGDGNVTNADVLMIYRYIYNAELYPLDVTVGDVDGDGSVTNADVLMIYRYIYNPELYPIG